MFGMWFDSVPQGSPTGDVVLGVVIRGSSRRGVAGEDWEARYWLLPSLTTSCLIIPYPSHSDAIPFDISPKLPRSKTVS